MMNVFLVFGPKEEIVEQPVFGKEEVNEDKVDDEAIAESEQETIIGITHKQ